VASIDLSIVVSPTDLADGSCLSVTLSVWPCRSRLRVSNCVHLCSVVSTSGCLTMSFVTSSVQLCLCLTVSFVIWSVQLCPVVFTCVHLCPLAFVCNTLSLCTYSSFYCASLLPCLDTGIIFGLTFTGSGTHRGAVSLHNSAALAAPTIPGCRLHIYIYILQ